jgi:hypothetical protein
VWAWLVGLAGCALVCGDGTEWVDGQCVVVFTCLDACVKSAGTCSSGEDFAQCADRCAAGTGYDPACARDAACEALPECRVPVAEDASLACESMCAPPVTDTDGPSTCDNDFVAQCERRCSVLTGGFGPACVECLVAGGRETWAAGCSTGTLRPFPACDDRCQGGDPVWGPGDAERVCGAWCKAIPFQEDYGPLDLVGCNREAVARCEAGCAAAVQGKSQRCGACLLLADAPPTSDGEVCAEPTFQQPRACAAVCGR